MKLKKYFIVGALLTMIIGCGKDSGDSREKADNVVMIQIAYENNPGEPFDLACNEWKRLIEEKSKGKIIIISSHIMEDLNNLSATLYLFDNGKVAKMYE